MGVLNFNMLVYKCIVSDSEFLTDATDAEEMWGGSFLKCAGRYITIGAEEDIDIGGNASAEAGEDDGGVDDNSTQVIDLVHNFNLQPMEYTKKQYMSYIKPFLKTCVMHMKANDRADEVASFKENVQSAIKEITAEWDEYCCYVNEDYDCEGTTVLVRYVMEGDNCVPYFFYLKGGLKEQKC